MKRPGISGFNRGFCLLVVVLTLFAGRLGNYPSRVACGATVANLQDQLVSGLDVRRPVDMAFIARVVELVRLAGRVGLVK